MTRNSPDVLARPLLGGPEGAHLGAATGRFRTLGAGALLSVLGINTLLGVLLQVPCLARGWDLPFASYRMCASPVANGLLGVEFPEAAGRAGGALSQLAPGTGWMVEIGRWLGADDPAGTALMVMVVVLLVNVIAMAAMGVALLILARDRGWAAAAFVSPVILLVMGTSLDPVGVALALWALVLLEDPRAQGGAGQGSTGQGNAAQPSIASLAGAGGLLAASAFFNPLALLVLVAVIVVRVTRDRTADLLALLGTWTMVTGVLLLVDARVFARLQLWWADALDRGSIISLAALLPDADASLLTTTSVVIWVIALAAAVGVMVSLQSLRPLSLPAACGVLIGLSLLLMPAAPTVNALWLLPFAVLVVRHMWVLVAWGMSEAALAIAINLTDVSAMQIEGERGLSEVWLGIFTILRVCAVAFVVFFSVERLRAHDDVDVDDDAEATGSDDDRATTHDSPADLA